jgi:hypothetical protein
MGCRTEVTEPEHDNTSFGDVAEIDVDVSIASLSWIVTNRTKLSFYTLARIQIP